MCIILAGNEKETNMPKILTETQVAGYHEKGYAFPFSAMRAEDARKYREKLEAHEAQIGGKLTELGGSARFKNQLLLTWVNDLVKHPTILDAVEDIIGPNIMCYTSTFFIKEPNSPAIAGWHQDSTYFGLRPHEHITAWLALSASTADSGCLEFLPKNMRQLKHQENAMEHSVNGGKQKIIEGFDSKNAILAPIEPGSFSLHNTLCIHRSAPNNSSYRRIGIGISYIPTQVRCVGSQRMYAMLVRGQDSYGHFDLEPSPKSDLDADAQAAHDAVYKRYRENYNEQLDWHKTGRSVPNS
jgi:non-heme Fe2+,alpha-ketoglutarate-dependent halogenase